jgi:hypothetical protein
VPRIGTRSGRSSSYCGTALIWRKSLSAEQSRLLLAGVARAARSLSRHRGMRAMNSYTLVRAQSPWHRMPAVEDIDVRGKCEVQFAAASAQTADSSSLPLNTTALTRSLWGSTFPSILGRSAASPMATDRYLAPCALTGTDLPAGISCGPATPGLERSSRSATRAGPRLSRPWPGTASR